MVNHNWIETKLIQYERAKSSSAWNRQKERQLKYLLNLYHTGRFYKLSMQNIAHNLKQLTRSSPQDQ